MEGKTKSCVKSRLDPFFFFLVLAFIAFLFPIANPDLFWHLASAREAEKLGQLFLSWETFSFTKLGTYWINYEWGFQKIVWVLYKLGDFRILALFRATLLVAIIFLFDRYLLKCVGLKAWQRVINLLFAFYFLHTRADLQPELFSLLFLVVFFFLRDYLLKRLDPRFRGDDDLNPKSGIYLLLACYYLLFSIWANMHGGFTFAFGVLGLQIAACLLELINLYYQKWAYKKDLDFDKLKTQNSKLKTFFALLALAFSATLINPYGLTLYKSILTHLKEGAFIAQMINEWQATQFYHVGAWLYWAIFVISIAILLRRGFREQALLLEEIVIVLSLGFFTATHIRNLALFGLVCLPIFWKLILPYLSFALTPIPLPQGEGDKGIASTLTLPSPLGRGRWLKNSLRLLPIAYSLLPLLAMALLASHKLLTQSWQIGRATWASGGLPKTFLAAGGYPEIACQFLQRNPELLKLKTLSEWGWGGFLIWRLHEKGLRLFFDGRYIFVDLLRESNRHAEDPKNWEPYTKKWGIDLQILRYPDGYNSVYTPKLKGKGRDLAYRSWHALALNQKEWALVWWDHSSLIFARREKMSPKWIKEHEYTSRLPIDTFWVDLQVRRKEISLETIKKEIMRNGKEAGWNPINSHYLNVVRQFLKLSWQAPKQTRR